MIDRLPYKTKQFLVVLIKLSIVVGAFYFIYHKLVQNEALDFQVFLGLLTKNEVFSPKTVGFLLLLSVFNWFFEILKWQALVSSLLSISFKNAFEQSLSGLTASLMTPNRIGEYGAKAIYFPSQLRKKIMLLNLLGNMMQMTTTILFGSVGLLFFVSQYSLDINYLNIIIIVVLLILLFVILNHLIKQNTFEIKGFSMQRILKFIKKLPKTLHAKIALYSIARYLIFSFQFFYLLHIFGGDFNYRSAMMVIASMYLLASVIPSILLLDVVVKGSIAVYLFSMVGVNDLTILCIVTLMWLLNFVVPSVFGSYYVLNFNLPKKSPIT